MSQWQKSLKPKSNVKRINQGAPSCFCPLSKQKWLITSTFSHKNRLWPLISFSIEFNELLYWDSAPSQVLCQQFPPPVFSLEIQRYKTDWPSDSELLADRFCSRSILGISFRTSSVTFTAPWSVKVFTIRFTVSVLSAFSRSAVAMPRSSRWNLNSLNSSVLNFFRIFKRSTFFRLAPC